MPNQPEIEIPLTEHLNRRAGREFFTPHRVAALNGTLSLQKTVMMDHRQTLDLFATSGARPTVETDPGLVLRNYPNPFNSQTRIELPPTEALGRNATLAVYSLLGDRVLDLGPVLERGGAIVMRREQFPSSGVFVLVLSTGMKTIRHLLFHVR
jgi:hypothetical protein